MYESMFSEKISCHLESTLKSVEFKNPSFPELEVNLMVNPNHRFVWIIYLLFKTQPLGTCTATIKIASNICSLNLNIQKLSLSKEDDFDRKTNMLAVIGGDKITDEIVLNGESYFKRNSKLHSNIAHL